MLQKLIRGIWFCAALTGALHGHSVFATESANPNGYLTLKQPQPQPQVRSEKVEVIEFFTYACPICYAYEPALSAWVERNKGRIVFKRVPVSLRPQWGPVQKLYFALELLGKSVAMHKQIFDAIHKESQSIKSDEAVGDLIERLGLNRKQFTDVYFSEEVLAKTRMAHQMQTHYEVDQVPLIAVNGRYLTSPAKAGDMVGDDKPFAELEALSLKILDELLVKSTAN